MLKVERVSKSYRAGIFGAKTIPALRDISFTLAHGASVALIGESGCGKSTLARLLLGLEKPDRGTILCNGLSVPGKGAERKNLYRSIQPVFQDSGGCLNPRMKIRDCICEPLRNYCTPGPEEEKKKLAELLLQAELPANAADKYPHELSGGQQKRVCLARAVSIKPQLLILDEAVTGLDATITKKILLLLKRLQKEVGCGLFFITHDLPIALYMAERVLVMKDGEIVEQVDNAASMRDFSHPYSRKLFQSSLQTCSKRSIKWEVLQ